MPEFDTRDTRRCQLVRKTRDVLASQAQDQRRTVGLVQLNRTGDGIVGLVDQEELSRVTLTGREVRENHRIATGRRRQVDDGKGGVQGFPKLIDSLAQGERRQCLIAGKGQATEQARGHLGKQFRNEQCQVLSWSEVSRLFPYLNPGGVAEDEPDAR